MSEDAIHVLLVEDNPGDARLVRERVRDAPRLSLNHVETAAAAVAYLGTHDVSCILLDLGLPDSAGLDTLRRVLGTSPTAPVVVFTGHGDENMGQAAIREGAQDYLWKGQADEQLLVRAIRYAIERKRILTQLQAALEQVKTLSGLLPICCACKKIRDDEGYWKDVAIYFSQHSELQFTHGICPDCMQRLYGEFSGLPSEAK